MARVSDRERKQMSHEEEKQRQPGQNILKIAYFYNTAPVYCQLWDAT